MRQKPEAAEEKEEADEENTWKNMKEKNMETMPKRQTNLCLIHVLPRQATNTKKIVG